VATDTNGTAANSRARRGLGALSILPLAGFLLLVGFAGYAASIIGHWPYYAHPDPKELGLPRMVTVVGLASLLGLLSIILLPCGYILARMVARWRQRPLVLSPGTLPLYFAGAALWLIDFTLMHTGGPWPSLLNWILD
jgi:drug/metabolite transporter (DMT)-like permease